MKDFAELLELSLVVYKDCTGKTSIGATDIEDQMFEDALMRVNQRKPKARTLLLTSLVKQGVSDAFINGPFKMMLESAMNKEHDTVNNVSSLIEDYKDVALMIYRAAALVELSKNNPEYSYEKLYKNLKGFSFMSAVNKTANKPLKIVHLCKAVELVSTCFMKSCGWMFEAIPLASPEIYKDMVAYSKNICEPLLEITPSNETIDDVIAAFETMKLMDAYVAVNFTDITIVRSVVENCLLLGVNFVRLSPERKAALIANAAAVFGQETITEPLEIMADRKEAANRLVKWGVSFDQPTELFTWDPERFEWDEDGTQLTEIPCMRTDYEEEEEEDNDEEEDN